MLSELKHDCEGQEGEYFFESEANQNIEEEPVLLETAGFLPLNNICQHSHPPPLYNLDTANSSERPAHKNMVGSNDTTLF